MDDTNNMPPTGSVGPGPQASPGRDASPSPCETSSGSSRDSGSGHSLFNTDGNDVPDVYYYSNDSNSSSTTEDANPLGEAIAPCDREDCTAQIAQQTTRINALEQFMQLRARNQTGEVSIDLAREREPHRPGCIHDQIKVLQEREKEIRDLLAEARLQKDQMSKREAELAERMEDVSKLLDTVQQKEDQLVRTHKAIDSRMDKLDRRLEVVREQETELVKRKKDLNLRQEVIEQQTQKLENSQETFKKQSALLSNLLRQQHETKTALDKAKETLEAHENSVVKGEAAVAQREVAVAKREIAMAKREYIMVQREKALLQHEQAVHRYVEQHQQSEAEFKQRMQELMQESLQNTVQDLPSEGNKDALESAGQVFIWIHSNISNPTIVTLIDSQEHMPEEVTSASHAPDATISRPLTPYTEAPIPSSMIPPVRQRRELYGRPDSRLLRRTRN